MSKKLLILITLVPLLGGGIFWVWQSRSVTAPVVTEPVVVTESTKYVTNVDPDVSHWQTKETKGFSIKFPKEWYWIEFPGYDDQGSGGSYVVSNNPNFPLNEYSDLGIFPSQSYKLVLKDNTEIVIDFSLYDYGPQTSSLGNPLDPVSELNMFLHLVPRINSTAECEPLLVRDGNSTNMTSTYCSINQENHQKDLVYYKASKMFSLMLTMRTTDRLSIDPSILKDIAESFVLSY